MAQDSLTSTSGKDWTKLANAYKEISSEVVQKPLGNMLERVNALSPFAKATAILDNGCGPGVIMSRIIEDYGHAIPLDCTLLCADFSDAMIEQVRSSKAQAAQDSVWRRVETKVQNAMDLADVQSESHSHVLAGLVYFMTPDPQKCLSESKRVLKAGGILAVSSWQGGEWMEVTNLINVVRPDKHPVVLPESWRTTQAVEAELAKAGFRDAEAREVETTMRFQSSEVLVNQFLTYLPHLIKAQEDMSEDEIARLRKAMTDKLTELSSNTPGSLRGVMIMGTGKK